MSSDVDVVVVGGGLAGCMAAFGAAETGASVRLISKKESTLQQASGLIDLLGYLPDSTVPVVDPIQSVPELPLSHPYQILGQEIVERGMGTFDNVMADHYAGGHTTRNGLFPTTAGTVKPTARYPRGMSPGLASRSDPMLLVGFQTLVEFDAPYMASRLKERVPFCVRGVTLEFPGMSRADATRMRYATALDRNQTVDGGRPVREALAERIVPHLEDARRVGLPAVLGRRNHRSVRSDLSNFLGVPVFEVPGGPPSLPGMRLRDRLKNMLGQSDVRVLTGTPVVDATTTDAEIDNVVVDHEGRTSEISARQYVLSTGGLVGRGLSSGRDEVQEPLFGCHVPAPADRYQWFEDAVFGNHAFTKFGVRIDSALRPLDGGNRPEYRNLRAAGSVIGGVDLASQNAGSGFSIVTGVTAGQIAGQEVML